MSVHVPAWKRIGLELKFARNTPDAVAVPAEQRQLAARTGQEQNGPAGSVKERPSKRRRLDHDQLRQEQRIANALSNSNVSSREPTLTTTEIDVKNDKHSNFMNEGTTSRQRKKSVSFATDTKADDGDTRTTIDFPTGSPGNTPKKTVSTTELATTNSPRSVTNPPKKRKAPIKVGTSDSSKNLEYLRTHYEDRSTWKFNKNRDVWILTHALDTDSIPTSQNRALAGYVHGLPERAASRSRLIERCREVLHPMGVEGSTIDQAAIKQHLISSLNMSEGIDKTAGLDRELEALPRSYLLLWAMNVDTDDQHENTTTASTSEGKRKKKSRTAAPIDLSSSSESDSDSSSSDSDVTSDSVSKMDFSRGFTEGKVSSKDRQTKIPPTSSDTSSDGSSLSSSHSTSSDDGDSSDGSSSSSGD